MRESLPRYPEDDVKFVLCELPKIEPCSAAEFFKSVCKLDPRPTGAPSKFYQRICAAFRAAMGKGLLTQNGRKYRVVRAT